MPVDERVVVRHERRADRLIVSHILTGGAVTLHPSGIVFTLDEIYEGA